VPPTWCTARRAVCASVMMCEKEARSAVASDVAACAGRMCTMTRRSLGSRSRWRARRYALRLTWLSFTCAHVGTCACTRACECACSCARAWIRMVMCVSAHMRWRIRTCAHAICAYYVNVLANPHVHTCAPRGGRLLLLRRGVKTEA